MGQWYYPDGSQVGVMDASGNYYRNRGQSVVRLHRRNGAMSPTGVFCCEITANETYCIGVYKRGTGKKVYYYSAFINFLYCASVARYVQCIIFLFVVSSTAFGLTIPHVTTVASSLLPHAPLGSTVLTGVLETNTFSMKTFSKLTLMGVSNSKVSFSTVNILLSNGMVDNLTPTPMLPIPTVTEKRKPYPPSPFGVPVTTFTIAGSAAVLTLIVLIVIFSCVMIIIYRRYR